MINLQMLLADFDEHTTFQYVLMTSFKGQQMSTWMAKYAKLFSCPLHMFLEKRIKICSIFLFHMSHEAYTPQPIS